MDWPALSLSLKLAFATTALLLVVGLPLAYWLSSSRFTGKWLIEAVLTLPIVLPPTVLGFYFLAALGPQSPLGRVYQGLGFGTLPFSFTGLLIGSLIYSLPFALQPFLIAFSSIHDSLIEASWCLGQSRAQTIWKIVLPLGRSGIIAGCVLSFAHTLGEFGIVMMIGGNIPGETRTLSVSMYDSLQALNFPAASRSALLLLMVSFGVLTGTSWLKKRSLTA
jgi:molybdate transport system permease protein